MATTIGNLNIKVSAGMAGLKSDLEKGKEYVRDFGTHILKGGNPLENLKESAVSLAGKLPLIGAAAGIVAGTLASKFHESLDKLGELRKASLKLGADAETISMLKFASKGDFDALVHGLTKFQEKLADASAGSKEARINFRNLGLDWKELSTRELTGQLEGLVNRFKEIHDPAQRTYFMFKLFGKAGPELTPVFTKLSRGIALTTEEANKAGAIFSSAEVAAANAAKKGLHEFDEKIDNLWMHTSLKLIPAVEALLKLMEKVGSYTDKAQDIPSRVTAWALKQNSLLGGAALAAFGNFMPNAPGRVAPKHRSLDELEIPERVRLEEKYAGILAGMQNPFEKQAESIAELNRAVELKALTWRQADKIQEHYNQELQKTLGLDKLEAQLITPMQQYYETLSKITDLELMRNKTLAERNDLVKKAKDELLSKQGLGTETPYEQLQKKLQAIQQDRAAKIISEERAGFLANQLLSPLLQQQNQSRYEPPGALERGSAAEYSARLAALGQGTPATTLQEAMKKLAEQEVQESKRGNQFLKEIADSVKNAPAIRVLGKK